VRCLSSMLRLATRLSSGVRCLPSMQRLATRLSSGVRCPRSRRRLAARLGSNRRDGRKMQRETEPRGSLDPPGLGASRHSGPVRFATWLTIHRAAFPADPREGVRFFSSLVGRSTEPSRVHRTSGPRASGAPIAEATSFPRESCGLQSRPHGEPQGVPRSCPRPPSPLRAAEAESLTSPRTKSGSRKSRSCRARPTSGRTPRRRSASSPS
jgi:hypothetical protein